MPLIEYLFFGFVLVMAAQGLLSIFFSLYIWEKPERIRETASPRSFAAPAKTFTVLLPARHEEAVIGDTIKGIAGFNYPELMFEVLVVCDAGDTRTIEAAEKSIAGNGLRNAAVIKYEAMPINKPHGLNRGLEIAKGDLITIFDAEDEIHPDLLKVINTIYLDKNPDIVQAGVQLMDYDSHWFSVHNVLEYYFWFKSRMHFHANAGMVPLGGNTVFFKTQDVRAAGGWDINCLTEDAEIGIRLSAMGKKIVATYDPEHVTKEETPGSVRAFIKQRTRWNQGFIQVLKKGHWRKYDTWLKSLLCFYTLFFPVVQAIMLLLAPVTTYIGFSVDLPFILSFISFLPVLLLLLQLVINGIGLYEFGADQKLRISPVWYFVLAATFIPFQVLLSAGALRATYRELRGRNNWEKTAHSGAHRARMRVNNELLYPLPTSGDL